MTIDFGGPYCGVDRSRGAGARSGPGGVGHGELASSLSGVLHEGDCWEFASSTSVFSLATASLFD